MHWQMIGENATMFWPSALKLRSIGLFGLVLRFKLQVWGCRASGTRGAV